MRNTSFDNLKAILIFFVIAGHIIQGPLEDSTSRSIIYFFHMPLFLAISGYFTSEKFLTQSVTTFFIQCKDRLIVPYIFALTIYTLYLQPDFYIENELNIWHLTKFYIYPFYHLWYIPALIIFYIYSRYVIGTHHKRRLLALCISACIAALMMTYEDSINKIPWTKYFGDKRFYYYFYFFYLGHIISLKKIQVRNFNVVIILLISSIASYIISTDNLIKINSLIAANTLIIIISISLCNLYPTTANNLLTRIGRVSLPIYLWHVIPILMIKSIDLNNSLYFYGLTTLCCFILVLAAIHLEDKNILINRILYGKKQAPSN